MKIRFLGTGYGECKIKKKTSKDYRKNGGLIIDDKILIDAPLDIFDVADELGLSDLLSEVTDIIISHSHHGHFSAESIARLSEKKKITVYATRQVLSLITPSKNLTLYEIGEFTKFTLLNYEIITLPTNHKTEIYDEKCLNLLVCGDKSLFYALDGGFINNDAFSVLKNFKIDVFIMECALDNSPATEKNLYHNDIHTNARIKEIFLSSKICNDGTKFLLTHIPTSKKRAIYDELAPIAREYGLSLAYDGYFLRI
ncbi:MAG: MBL fold metallo-hydrolase [Clostridia bacterium]|nr:MBL fold metallo-hydrolase [Clostridia bacterium]